MNVGLQPWSLSLGRLSAWAPVGYWFRGWSGCGESLGLSEALLGILAALAADAPEITASITALLHHQATVGAGVVLGSNVFNLAAPAGPGSGRSGSDPPTPQSRRLQWSRRHAGRCRVPPERGGHTLGWGGARPCPLCPGPLHRPFGRTQESWDGSGLPDEMDRVDDRRHRRGGERARRGHTSPTSVHLADAVMAAGALVVVILASVAMERGASSLGGTFRRPRHRRRRSRPSRCDEPSQCRLGHLPRQAGRGAAALSTALNSNSLERHRRPLAPSDADRAGQAVWIGTARGRLVRRTDRADVGSRLWGARAARAQAGILSSRPTPSSCSLLLVTS